MHRPHPDIAIIIPAYNEEQTIGQVIKAFHQQMPDARIVVVDNHSSDRTGDIARETVNELDRCGVVLYEDQQGKSSAVRKAFREVDADIYVMVDADLTYPADNLPELLAPVLAGEADLVVGDRLSGGEYKGSAPRTFHSLGNELVRSKINWLFGANLNDIMSGYRVMSRKFVKLYPVLSKGFGLETEMTIHALDKQFVIKEVPIQYLSRPAGSTSKLNTFGDGWRVIVLIIRLYKNHKPLQFFLSLSALFAVGGLLVSLPVLYEWITTGLILRIPSAVLATGMELFAVILFSLGMILETVVRFHRFDYELRSIEYHDEQK